MDQNLEALLSEKAVKLERRRKTAIALNYGYRIIRPLASLFNFASIVLLFINVVAPILLPALLVVGAIGILLSIVPDPKEAFSNKVKRDVLPEIFKHVNPSLEYSPSTYNEVVLHESELLSKGFFRDTLKTQGRNHVIGQVGGIDVEFFEIQFYKETVDYLKTAGGCLFNIIAIPVELFKNIFLGDSSADDVFMGIEYDTKLYYSGFFMYADFHKDFKGKVLMIPKQNDRIQDRVNELLEPKNLQKITVENPIIDEYYNIYSSNQQLGYYVLSQNLIDRVHSMAENARAMPIISLIDGKMYFMIPWYKRFFTIDARNSINGSDYFKPYIEEIRSFEKIVQSLNLDTRIWSKV